MLDAVLRGARTHNLKGVDLEVRPGELLVLTGLSGSGKSSLALDTLYAEGQRRFVESFSPYARQFLERLERPPVDSLSPVGAGVSVDRSAPVKSSRSTVATMADLESYLAGLFSQESVPHCPEHQEKAQFVDLAEAEKRLLKTYDGKDVILTYRVFVQDTEEFLSLRQELLEKGYRRVICGSEMVDWDGLRPSVATAAGKIFVVLDRLKANVDNRSRLREALEIAFSRSRGILTPGQAWVFERNLTDDPLCLRNGLTCPTCARELLSPRPGYFSYESPLGACENCRGFGRVMGIDLDRVIPDDRLSLAQGAIRPWRGPKTEWERRQLSKFCKAEGIDEDAPYAELSRAQQEKIILGQGKRGKQNYWGVLEWFSWLETKAYKMHVRVLLSRYRSYDPCPVCKGSRLTEQSLWYKLGGLDLGQWHRLEIGELNHKLAELVCTTPQGRILHRELSARLDYLEKVGLSYLTLDRQARTLSGGESQRVTLTAALGTSLHNALFVLDEPTVGLHPADIAPLCRLMRELAERGNAVIVIEHEPLVMASADRIVELGPAAGQHGGRIVFDGAPAEAKKIDTATARAFSPPRERGASTHTTGFSPPPWLRLQGASAFNLKRIDVDFPLNCLVAVTGPSGSGKSTLLVDTLYRAVARQLHVADIERPLPHESITGWEEVAALELVDQSPLGRTSRGNPATYTKAWDTVRKLFASQPEAEAKGYTASHFSFNVAGGRCETCAGEGHETVEMQFLADVSLVCPVCAGRRFKDEVLSVLYRGRSISDVLNLTVDEALRIFDDSAPIRRALAPLKSLGLSYLRLGQPLSTLSGGEAQRLKLARSLAAPKPGTLYVLDEPSAGLHKDEIELLLDALSILVRSGGSVMLVDHDLHLISAADHVIELGPGGGARGGEVIFSGTVRELLDATTPTGIAFRQAQKSPRLPRKKRLKPKEFALSVRGAKEHTLDDVSVEIPHNRLTLVTGPSGSGKSTLAFDVIFAEGQRRFLETLTPYARRFLPTLPRPHVDSVEGVPPSIALEQRTTRIGARSTVATVTEVAHYLRLAFAKLGTPYCPSHDEAIESRSTEELWAALQRKRGRGQIWAPVVAGRKGSYVDVFTSAKRAGIERAVADGKVVSTDAPPRLAKTKEHDIDLVFADSVAFKDIDLDQLRAILRWGRGSLKVVTHDKAAPSVEVLSTGGTCPRCDFSMLEMDPRFFSFNTVQGQCLRCEGTGYIPEANRRGSKTSKSERKQCDACDGTRLSPFSRKVRFLGYTYPNLTKLCVSELLQVVRQMDVAGPKKAVFSPILAELLRRLEFLNEVGLDYLSLDRDAASLSGGELQRLRLAAQLGSGLTGALFVLDEPTIGLHPRDTARLLSNLRALVDTGSTVLMVEHDEDAIRAADYVIDMGPGGGRRGGRVMAAGPPQRVLSDPTSSTALALSQPRKARALVELGADPPMMSMEGARAHNLKGDTIRFPAGALTVVAGVSGSGKSTLIRSELLPRIGQLLSGKKGRGTVDGCRLSGFETIKRAIAVDQSPIGRTPRSTPATFLGIFDHIRALFAKSPQAMVRGFSPARFSFNTGAGGRCPTCEGQGALSHEMSFLPDVVTVCPACDGQRFEDRTLEVQYLGKSIGEVLNLSAQEAVDVFSAHPKISAPLQIMCDLGAGYITLGQGSHTLSGGEAQRLKLATELAAGTRHETTLYVLDEPTTGLHMSDVARLIEVLSRLVERGDSLVVIEHHPDVIRAADWVVELGPEGGPEGGRIVYQGAVSGLKRQDTHTARIL